MTIWVGITSVLKNIWPVLQYNNAEVLLYQSVNFFRKNDFFIYCETAGLCKTACGIITIFPLIF